MSTFLKKMTAEQFNAQFPLGAPFDYFSTRNCGPCDPYRTNTRSEAWTLGHGAVVVSIVGRSGGVLITHLKPVQP